MLRIWGKRRLLNIADSADTDTDVSLTVDLTAHKEKLQKETVTLVDGGNAANRTTFILQARVLGRSFLPLYVH